MPTNNWEPLVAWTEQRELLRSNKASGAEQPWTGDPILNAYRFCNVRRKHDRVSQWLLKNIILPYADQPYLPEWVALARIVNWPPTLKVLLEAGHNPRFQPYWGAIGRSIDIFSESGEKAWTGAFIIRPPKEPWLHLGKGEYVCEVMLGHAFGDEKIMSSIEDAFEKGSCKLAHQALCSAYSWGAFTAGQVVADWAWTRYLAGAKDLYSWAPMGPGSLRGFNRLMGRALTQRTSEEEWCKQLQLWRAQIIKKLGSAFEDLTLMDVQNCLCEFDKYERVRLGEGRPKSFYRPEIAY